MSGELATRPLSADQARTLTDEVKEDAARLWAKLLTLYEGQAHVALGYASWGDYYAAEFGQAGARGYQLLDAGRVHRAVESHSKGFERPATDAVARELAPVLRKRGPEAVAETWDDAVDEHGPAPTAPQVRGTVQLAPARPHRRKLEDASEYPSMFNNTLSNGQSAINYAVSMVVHAARAETDSRKLADWLEVVDVAMADLKTIRRELRKGSNDAA